MKNADPIEYFSAQAEDYINNVGGEQYHQYRFKSFSSLLPSTPTNLNVFDFGCGIGTAIIHLTNSGHIVRGCDPALGMAKVAQSKLSEAGIDANFVSAGNVLSLANEQSKTYDVVMALDVLPYLSEDEEDEFYKQSHRITKDEGVVIASGFNPWVDLTTFNRYTVEFWAESVLPFVTNNDQDRKELLEILKTHITHPNIPVSNEKGCSEKDFFGKYRKRVDPISYQRSVEQKGFKVEAIEFSHYFPMPPQFMEHSGKYSQYIYKFEDTMRARNSTLGYVFASIYYVKMRKSSPNGGRT
jgi:2-polyprenyl-3-methyl-5-hydroxy-6-metoxy-1,4-benzoquinol methylase